MRGEGQPALILTSAHSRPFSRWNRASEKLNCSLAVGIAGSHAGLRGA